MSEIQGEKENRGKDFIKTRCPLLRTFLDSFGETDRDLWLEILNSTYSDIREETGQTVNPKVVKRNIRYLLGKAEESQIFDLELDKEVRHSTLSILTAIGYEVGDNGEVMAFLGEIFERLTRLKIIDSSLEACGLVYKALYMGTQWKTGMLDNLPGSLKTYRTKADLP